ncbi:hypothetical protein FORC47_p082 (plasmid) [Bacillus cereus]|nr:hypothetical protein FORC47_p082 [Bacillus cereus]
MTILILINPYGIKLSKYSDSFFFRSASASREIRTKDEIIYEQ